MSQKALIISLIQQDLKHTQIVSSLGHNTFPTPENQSLDLLDIVANLMHVPEGRMEIYWGRMYMSYVKDAALLANHDQEKSIKRLAKKCYNNLDWVMHSGVIL